MVNYLMILWFALCVGGVAAGCIWLDHLLERRRMYEKEEWIEKALWLNIRVMTMELIDEGMDKVMEKSVEMTKKKMMEG